MHIIDTPAYRNAFLQYLRKGTPLDIALKAAEQERRTSQYIWRTMGDGKVRSAHAANDGRVFSWDIRPSTGYPGEDFNCRCKAEAYIKGESEFAYQNLIGEAFDNSYKWIDEDFIAHFYFGKGKGLSLSETGHLKGVIDYFAYKLGVYGRVQKQIIEKARNHSNLFAYDFNNSYDFGDYLYVFGNSAVSGVFTGKVIHNNGMMSISGEMTYYYFDTFTDHVNAREILPGTSSTERSYGWWITITDGGGTYYDIRDSWKTRVYIEAKFDRENSRYTLLGE